MQPADVYIDAKMQRDFKRRAVSSFHKNKEYMEAIFIRRGIGEFHIVKFIKLKLKDVGEGTVDCDQKHYWALKREARDQGLEFGTVHTHLWGDTSLSEWDHKEGVKEGETLLGVCFISKDEKTGRTKTDLNFWQPQLPCKLKVLPSK
jgi:hypothetical protein